MADLLREIVNMINAPKYRLSFRLSDRDTAAALHQARYNDLIAAVNAVHNGVHGICHDTTSTLFFESTEEMEAIANRLKAGLFDVDHFVLQEVGTTGGYAFGDCDFPLLRKYNPTIRRLG